MPQLIPENVVKRLDSLGRVTLPKGLRDRWYLENDQSELEIFTAIVDGRNCICLAKPVREEDEIESAIRLLEEKGYEVKEKNGN